MVDPDLQDGYRMWSPLQKAGSLQVHLALYDNDLSDPLASKFGL